jgi:RNA polymerase subunit RPABC4/transcription elongation factor Spt4
MQDACKRCKQLISDHGMTCDAFSEESFCLEV